MTTYNALDSTGHGHTAVYNPALLAASAWHQPGPYLGGFKNFSVHLPTFVTSGGVSLSQGSWDGWVYYFGDTNPPHGSGSFNWFWIGQAASTASNGVGVYFGGLNPGRGWTNPQDAAMPSGGFIVNALNSNAFPWNTWRHFGMRCNATANRWDLFLDGVNVGIVAVGDANSNGSVILGYAGGNATPCRLAGVACYNSKLTDGQIAAHYAARTTHDDYKAAVLADSPEALWMLDEPNNAGWYLGQVAMSV